MVPYDIKEEPLRERTRRAVAFLIGDGSERLMLKTDPRLVELMTERNRNLYLNRKVNGRFNPREQLVIVEDVVSAVESKGYAPSEVSKYAMSLGYVPTMIIFRKRI